MKLLPIGITDFAKIIQKDNENLQIGVMTGILRVAKSEDELEKKAEEALEQIEMKQRGIFKIQKLGFAFCGKKVSVKSI